MNTESNPAKEGNVVMLSVTRERVVRLAPAKQRMLRRIAVLCGSLLLVGGASPAYASTVDPQPSSVDLYHYVECNPPLSIGDQYTYDDTDVAHIRYHQYWKPERPGRELHKGTQHITNSGGSTASFVLPSGAYEFAFGFTKMRNAGLADIYFNNQVITTLDMYSPVTQYNCALILYWNPPPGTFMVKALNRQNPESTGTYVNIDYIYYAP